KMAPSSRLPRSTGGTGGVPSAMAGLQPIGDRAIAPACVVARLLRERVSRAEHQITAAPQCLLQYRERFGAGSQRQVDQDIAAQDDIEAALRRRLGHQ